MWPGWNPNKIFKGKIIISSFVSSCSVSACAPAIVSHLLRIKSDYSHRFRFRHKFGCNSTWPPDYSRSDPTCYWITIRPGAQSSPASTVSLPSAHGKCSLLWKLEPILNIVKVYLWTIKLSFLWKPCTTKSGNLIGNWYRKPARPTSTTRTLSGGE